MEHTIAEGNLLTNAQLLIQIKAESVRNEYSARGNVVLRYAVRSSSQLFSTIGAATSGNIAMRLEDMIHKIPDLHLLCFTFNTCHFAVSAVPRKANVIDREMLADCTSLNNLSAAGERTFESKVLGGFGLVTKVTADIESQLV